PLEITNQASVQERAHDILSKVGLSHRLDHYPNQLSGGEQQRVALARAFVTEPDILFADEPTGNLDTPTGKAIAQQLFDLNESRHTTLVLVTHDLTLAEQCQRTLVMNAGILEEQSR
ncbi:MAG: ATP-binding cassette domain-containing protein, partial [Pseudomonadales bacterium]|nr:ATP-binding cassette domain-containing protein [Pseudomonadales bacterium]